MKIASKIIHIATQNECLFALTQSGEIYMTVAGPNGDDDYCWRQLHLMQEEPEQLSFGFEK